MDAGGQAIYLSNGETLTLVVDTEGPFQGFGQIGANIAVNSGGSVAFIGHLDNGDYGLYLAKDGLLEEVIRRNDPLFGSTPSSLNFSRGLNDDGDVAFFYTLADGRSGIATALAREFLPGDYDSDYNVGGTDLLAWQRAFGAQGAGLPADGNGDLVVDSRDYNVWKLSFGATGSASSWEALGRLATQVPEPSSLLIACAAATAMSPRRERTMRWSRKIRPPS